MPFPVGTTLHADLPGEAHEDGRRFAWEDVRIVAHHDFGSDNGGVVNVVAPITFDDNPSPRTIDDDNLIALGYRVVDLAKDAGAWETDLAAPASSGLQYGQPGWTKAMRLQEEAATRARIEAEAS